MKKTPGRFGTGTCATDVTEEAEHDDLLADAKKWGLCTDSRLYGITDGSGNGVGVPPGTPFADNVDVPAPPATTCRDAAPPSAATPCRATGRGARADGAVGCLRDAAHRNTKGRAEGAAGESPSPATAAAAASPALPPAATDRTRVAAAAAAAAAAHTRVRPGWRRRAWSWQRNDHDQPCGREVPPPRQRGRLPPLPQPRLPPSSALGGRQPPTDPDTMLPRKQPARRVPVDATEAPTNRTPVRCLLCKTGWWLAAGRAGGR